MKLSVCLPTRGRPERFGQMYESVKATQHGDVEVVAVLDDDDETADLYPEGPTYVVVPAGTNQSGLWSVAWEHATGDIAHMGADDLIYRTQSWDLLVARAFQRWREPIGMVYVNDRNPVRDKPFAGQNVSDAEEGKFCFSANPFVTREWIAALDGFFTPPFYKSWEADTWIYQLAEGISRVAYVGDVVVEHMHPMAGKAEMDETYQRGAWGDKRMMRRGWMITKSAKMKALRAEQVEALTRAIQAYRQGFDRNITLDGAPNTWTNA